MICNDDHLSVPSHEVFHYIMTLLPHTLNPNTKLLQKIVSKTALAYLYPFLEQSIVTTQKHQERKEGRKKETERDGQKEMNRKRRTERERWTERERRT